MCYGLPKLSVTGQIALGNSDSFLIDFLVCLGRYVAMSSFRGQGNSLVEIIC